jgi:hypothetical protein
MIYIFAIFLLIIIVLICYIVYQKIEIQNNEVQYNKHIATVQLLEAEKKILNEKIDKLVVALNGTRNNIERIKNDENINIDSVNTTLDNIKL